MGTLWLANLTGELQRVEIAGLEVAGARLSLLDRDSFAHCVAGPDGFEDNAGAVSGAGLTLAPDAVARLEAGVCAEPVPGICQVALNMTAFMAADRSSWSGRAVIN